MTNPLFSTYSQGENQVTGTVLSVFEHLGTSLVENQPFEERFGAESNHAHRAYQGGSY